jgi:hypothetical protein
MAYLVSQDLLLFEVLFVFVAHLERVAYDMIRCPTPLFRPTNILEVFELVARVENWKEVRTLLSDSTESYTPIAIR